MLRVAILGDVESIKGFSAVGLDTYFCDGDEDGAAVFRRLTAGEEYGVIYVTEELFSQLDKDIRKLDDQLIPAIIPIPGVKGNTGIGMTRLSDSVERAVGSDIIFGK